MCSRVGMWVPRAAVVAGMSLNLRDEIVFVLGDDRLAAALADGAQALMMGPSGCLGQSSVW